MNDSECSSIVQGGGKRRGAGMDAILARWRGKEDGDRRQNAQDPAARRGAFYGRCSSSGSLRPKRMGEATGRQSGALYGLWSFRRTSPGSLAKFAAIRRASSRVTSLNSSNASGRGATSEATVAPARVCHLWSQVRQRNATQRLLAERPSFRREQLLASTPLDFGEFDLLSGACTRS
jgi:hypothetical protein